MLRDLIQDLGGNVCIAQTLTSDNAQLTPDAITKWIKRGRVPFEWRTAVRHMFDQRGLEFAKDDDRRFMLEPDITKIPPDASRFR